MSKYIRGWSESHHGGRIRKTQAGSFVAERSTQGKLRRSSFDKRSDAITWLKELGARRDKHGHLAAALSGNQTRDAMDALERLQSAGIDTTFCNLADFYIERNRPTARAMTVLEAFEAMIRDAESPPDGSDPLRAETIGSKKRRLRSFVDMFSTMDVRHISPAHVEDWEHTFNEGISTRTRLNRKAELQALLNYCETKLDGFENTACKTRIAKGTPDPKPILSPKQAEKMLRYLEEHHSPKHVLTLALGLFAGLRPYELTRTQNPLTWDQIRLDEKQIFIRAAGTKAKTWRTVPIFDNLAAWLERYPGTGKVSLHPSNFSPARAAAAKHARVTWRKDMARSTFASAAGEIHGPHRAAGAMGHKSGLDIWQQHYRGQICKADAERFFSILPTPAKAGTVIELQLEAS